MCRRNLVMNSAFLAARMWLQEDSISKENRLYSLLLLIPETSLMLCNI